MDVFFLEDVPVALSGPHSIYDVAPLSRGNVIVLSLNQSADDFRRGFPVEMRAHDWLAVIRGLIAMKLSDDLDVTDDMSIELSEFFCWHPKLLAH